MILNSLGADNEQLKSIHSLNVNSLSFGVDCPMHLADDVEAAVAAVKPLHFKTDIKDKYYDFQ